MAIVSAAVHPVTKELGLVQVVAFTITIQINQLQVQLEILAFLIRVFEARVLLLDLTITAAIVLWVLLAKTVRLILMNA